MRWLSYRPPWSRDASWSAGNEEKCSEPPKRSRDLATRYEELGQLRNEIEELLAAPALSLVASQRSGARQRKSLMARIKDRLIVAALF